MSKYLAEYLAAPELDNLSFWVDPWHTDPMTRLAPGMCFACDRYPKQLAALKVHVLSRSFQYRIRCGE